MKLPQTTRATAAAEHSAAAAVAAAGEKEKQWTAQCPWAGTLVSLILLWQLSSVLVQTMPEEVTLQLETCHVLLPR